ncbi:VOC family protein [Pseudonocardia sp. CA-107938]|uniref:VOC family protein n=1 Tax=Pseudonocardia sp. CA-107938 TaxID=3240021 RepID=UPI003D8BFC5E
MIKLHDIDHVALGVEDLDASAHSWQVEFGLAERERTPTESFLACNYEPYSLVLRRTNNPGAIHTAYNLDPEFSLADAEKHLKDHGVLYTRSENAVEFLDPEGNGVHLVPYRPRDGANAFPVTSRRTDSLRQAGPRRLGHVNYLTADLPTMVDFYTTVVGQEVTDYLGDDAGVFLRIGGDHHVNAFVNTGTPHFHHVAFDLIDFGQIRSSFDHLAQHGRWFPWGPVRHGIGGNLAGYVRLPEAECFVELYCDMEQIDRTHLPRTFPDDRRSSNVWGMLPPRSYFRFDKETVDAERESLRSIWD